MWDLSTSGFQLRSPALAGRFFTTSATWEAPLPRASDANDLICVFTHVSVLDFPGGSDSKASVYNVGDLGSIPGSGRFPGEGNGNPL